MPGAAAARPGTAAGQRPDGAGTSREADAAQPRGAGTGHSARQDVTPGDGKDAPADTGTFQAAADGHDETHGAGPPRGHQVRPAAIGGKPSAEQHAQSLSARSGRAWEFRFDLGAAADAAGAADPAPDVSPSAQAAATAQQARAVVVPAPALAAASGEQHTAAPPDGTQPLAAHAGWAGNLRPERLLYADGTPLTIRGQGDDNDQVLPATAAGAVPAPAGSEYGPGGCKSSAGTTAATRSSTRHWPARPASTPTPGSATVTAPGGKPSTSPKPGPPLPRAFPRTWSASVTSSRSSADRAAAPWTCAKSSRSGPARALPQAGSNSRSPASDPPCSTRRTGACWCASRTSTRRFRPLFRPSWRLPLTRREPQIPLLICLPGARAAAGSTASRVTARAAPRPAPAALIPPAGSRPGTAPQPAAAPGTRTRPAPGEPAGSGEPEPAASPLTNSDLADALAGLPGFARWLSRTGPPGAARHGHPAPR